MRATFFNILIFGAVLALSVTDAFGTGAPWLMNYQGYLTDNLGNPLTGTYSLGFTIYDALSGGNIKWTETHPTVAVTNGSFSVILGSLSPLNSLNEGVFTYASGINPESERWLEITVNGALITPRTRLTSVPYAFAENHWTFRITDGSDTSLTTRSKWGLTRYGNTLYGNADSTHVNLGVEGRTGSIGANLKYCTVGGGLLNTASYIAATVAGGERDSATGQWSTVGGGYLNWSRGNAATIGGGQNNNAWGSPATIAGGMNNQAGSVSTTVSGGEDNSANGGWATVGGGDHNRALADSSVIGGGVSNEIPTTGSAATIVGGVENTASEDFSAVGGGFFNRAAGHFATIGGGMQNTAFGDTATIGGGVKNSASGWGATVGGGRWNNASGDAATIGGGYSNTAQFDEGTVGGGFDNFAAAFFSTVGGGGQNVAGGFWSTVAGGDGNGAFGDVSTVTGGEHGVANGVASTVGGGSADTADGRYATVGGGVKNVAKGDSSTVGGGFRNFAWGKASTVGGGRQNVANGWSATVGGGSGNFANDGATVPGGESNFAYGAYSFAAGQGVWVDYGAANTFAFGYNFMTTAPNAVIFHNSATPIRLGVGTTAPNTRTDINGDLALRRGSYSAVSGSNDNIVIGERSFVKITAPGVFTITGIAGGVDGKIVILYNSSASNMTIANESASSVAANRILTMTAANEVTVGTGNVTLIYDAESSRWIVTAMKP